MRPRVLTLLALCLTAFGCIDAAGAAQLLRQTWSVDGVRREALVHLPEDASGPAPLVFVFHGHGGSALQISESLPIDRLWPEALVVYPQGLPTPGQLTDPEGRQNGWQSSPGAQGDRDLRFFDVMLRGIEGLHGVDARRVYATGHSNGGAFTYLLWSQRRDVFAAFGPSGAIANRACRPLRPAPVIQVSGLNDPLVTFTWQREMIALLIRQGDCGPGRPVGAYLTAYASPVGAPVETYLYPGGHSLPPEAAPVIVAFFKSNPAP